MEEHEVSAHCKCLLRIKLMISVNVSYFLYITSLKKEVEK